MLANSGWLLLDRVLRLVIAITVGAWVARHLGPASFGLLAYALALLALFQAACSLGLDGIVVRDLSQSQARTGQLLGGALRLRLIGGAAGWLAMLLVVALLRPGDGHTLLLAAIVGAALVFQAADVVDLWLQSQSRSRISVPLRFAAYLAVAALRVALILADAPLWAFAAAVLADAALVAVAMVWAHRRWPSPTAWTWDAATARRLWRESWPLMLSAVSIGIYMRIDQVMLRQLAGERELGLFSAVLPFSQSWQIIPMSLSASLLPRLTQLKAEDPVRYRTMLQNTYTAFAWAGLLVAVATAVCAPWLVAVLLGPAYAEAVPILRIHVFANPFVFLGVAQGLAIVVESTPRLALAKTIIGAGVSLGANALLIPRWGALGTAMAAVLAQFVSVMLSNAVLAPAALRMQWRALVPLPVR